MSANRLHFAAITNATVLEQEIDFWFAHRERDMGICPHEPCCVELARNRQALQTKSKPTPLAVMGAALVQDNRVTVLLPLPSAPTDGLCWRIWNVSVGKNQAGKRSARKFSGEPPCAGCWYKASPTLFGDDSSGTWGC